MRLRPIKPQYEFEDLKRIDISGFETEPTIPEEEREPQLIDNQVQMHIPRTIPDTRTVAFNSNIQTTHSPHQDAPTMIEHMNHEPISDQEAFFVEGSVPLAHAETPRINWHRKLHFLRTKQFYSNGRTIWS